MRKVKFKKWIPIQYEPNNQGGQSIVPGTSQMETDFVNEGLFHQWATSYEQHNDGIAQYPVALVESEDGLIHEVHPANIKFEPITIGDIHPVEVCPINFHP